MGTIITRAPSGSLTEWTRYRITLLSRTWRRISAELDETVARARQRRALARLDNRMLQDLGLPPERVHGELRKWFWEI